MVDFFKNLQFFILPLGLGSKRKDFFESQIKKYGGSVDLPVRATHVIVEDTVAAARDKCVTALKSHDAQLLPRVQYLTTNWLSRCFVERKLVDVGGYEVQLRIAAADDVSQDTTLAGAAQDSIHVPAKRPVPGELSGTPSSKKEKTGGSPEPSTSKGGVGKNQAVVAELQKLADVFRLRKDQWRAYSYEKAISAISRHPQELSSFQEACAIPGVGEKMAGKVMEILECGKLRKVEELCSDEKTRVLEIFEKVWGAGPSTADGWYLQGYRTLHDLASKARLTKQQHVGLKHYSDIAKRIPRGEVERVGQLVGAAVSQVAPSAETVMVGSYRRGRPDSGDIDVMIVNDGSMTDTQLLLKVCHLLRASGLLKDDLIDLQEDSVHRKYFGVCQVPDTDWPHRRLDLFVVPRAERATALVHYTGSARFNRYIRLHAASLGMSLSQHGLYEGTVRKGSDILDEGKSVLVRTEEDIFRALGVEYKTPEERDH